jgi:hypothetical protein
MFKQNKFKLNVLQISPQAVLWATQLESSESLKAGQESMTEVIPVWA